MSEITSQSARSLPEASSNDSGWELHPGLRAMLEGMMKTLFEDTKEYAPQFMKYTTNRPPYASVPVRSEIVKAASASGMETRLEVKKLKDSSDFRLTYVARTEFAATESSSEFATEDPRLQLTFTEDSPFVTVSVLDRKNHQLKDVGFVLDNELALEVYADLNDAHELVNPTAHPDVIDPDLLIPEAA